MGIYLATGGEFLVATVSATGLPCPTGPFDGRRVVAAWVQTAPATVDAPPHSLMMLSRSGDGGRTFSRRPSFVTASSFPAAEGTAECARDVVDLSRGRRKGPCAISATDIRDS